MTVSREAIETAVLAYAEAINPGQPATWRLDGPLRKRMEAALTAAIPHLLPRPTASDDSRALMIVKEMCFDECCKTIDEKSCGCFQEVRKNLVTIRAEATLAATLAERERCAKVAEEARVAHSAMLGSPHRSLHGPAIAAAIRRAE